MWKVSLPPYFTRYLLAAIRAASRASEESYDSFANNTLLPVHAHPKACERRKDKYRQRQTCHQYRKYESWHRGHHGRNGTWWKAYSCNNGSNEQDDDPCYSFKGKFGWMAWTTTESDQSKTLGTLLEGNSPRFRRVSTIHSKFLL